MEVGDSENLEKIAKYIDQVARAADAVLSGPLTEDAVILLIKNKMSDKRIATQTIRDVLRASCRMKEYVVVSKDFDELAAE